MLFLLSTLRGSQPLSGISCEVVRNLMESVATAEIATTVVAWWIAGQLSEFISGSEHDHVATSIHTEQSVADADWRGAERTADSLTPDFVAVCRVKTAETKSGVTVIEQPGRLRSKPCR